MAVLVVLVVDTGVRAQHLGESNASQFRVVWPADVSRALGPVVQGSVYNDSIYQVRHVQLRIQGLDGSAAVKDETYKVVLGDIGPGSRAFCRPSSRRCRVSRQRLFLREDRRRTVAANAIDQSMRRACQGQLG